MLFTDDGAFAIPGLPLEDVRDPTGAGDSFAGGFLGYLDRARVGGEHDAAALRRAMAYGSVMASFNVEDFGTERVAAWSEAEIAERLGDFRRLTHFDEARSLAPVASRLAARMNAETNTDRGERDGGRGADSQDGGGVATADGTSDTLTVTDNRTGEATSSRSPTRRCKAMDLRQIKVSEDDFGMMSYDPAFTNTASCRSAITYIDGEAGILQHRGIPIEQLCEKSSYLEVAFLLVYGELPTQAQLERWIFDITHHTFVHEDIKQHLEGFRYDAHPMGMLLSSVGALSTFYPEAKQIDDPEERYMAAIRLIAKVPTLAAFAYCHNRGLPYVYPGQRPHLLRELPLDDVQEDRAQVRARSAPGEGARRALHPARRPRAELLDERRARRRLLAGRSLLGGRRRRRRPLRAAARRRQRGGAADAAADRDASRTSPTSSRASRTARRS